MKNTVIPSNHVIQSGAPVQTGNGVLLLRLPLPFALDHINVYFPEDGDGWILIDTGLYMEASTDILTQIIDSLCEIKRLKAALVTHAHVCCISAADWVCEHRNFSYGSPNRNIRV